MSIQRMVDAENPPTTVAGWKALFAATGATVAALYVPPNGQKYGWGKPAGNTPLAALTSLAQIPGAGLLPILVPTDSTSQTLGPAGMKVGAEIAIEWAAAGGFTELGGVPLDIEADWSAADLAFWSAFSTAFYQGGVEAGVVPIQYGSVAFLQHLATLAAADRIEAVWCGEYPTGQAQPTTPQACPGLTDLWVGAGQKGWQWKGSTSIAGYSVDLSVIDLPVFTVAPPPPPDPPPPPPPTPIQLVVGQPYLTPKGDGLTFS